MSDPLAPGVHERREQFTRATLPDGRHRDSEPETVGRLTLGEAVAAGFGRAALPKGTTFQRFERTVTTAVGEWEPVAAKEDGDA